MNYGEAKSAGYIPSGLKGVEFTPQPAELLVERVLTADARVRGAIDMAEQIATRIYGPRLDAAGPGVSDTADRPINSLNSAVQDLERSLDHLSKVMSVINGGL